MVLGAFVVQEDKARTLDAKLERLRHDHHLDRELKWGKVSRSMLPVYKAYVAAALEELRRDSPGYYAVVVDTSKLDHHRYNGGSAEIGFSKFVYQLLLKCARLFHAGANLDCFLDDRTTRQSLQELRSILNNGAANKLHARPFRRVEYRDSKTCNLVQLVDLLTGAVAYHWNGNQLEPGASPARVELAQFIAGRVGLKSLAIPTPPGRDKFSIWKFATAPTSRSPGRT